ncbi:hypothetical protein [Streptomyces herbicida]|uniref:hypothetical protein n=1 Tax=Streptomyces herbicida TaxID=3065675 RepID=UPI00292CAE3B|nr:hypothetical protein [Streptomyces sp. NEAU-HV9]
MSYDLAVWDGERPLDNHHAGSTYDELYLRYLESDDVAVPPAPRIAAYVEALVERYPDERRSQRRMGVTAGCRGGIGADRVPAHVLRQG